jgi:multidrug efflux pump subunit AcrB
VLVVVFLPVLIIPGSVGRLYQPIAVVIGCSILLSMVNALSFTPVSAALLLARQQDHGDPAWLARLQRFCTRTARVLDDLQKPYLATLDRVLARPRLVLIALLLGLVITGLGLQRLPTAFIPQEDDGQIRGVLVLPEGASLARTQAAMERLRAVVAKEPLIRTGNFYAGRSFGDSAPNKGVFFLRLVALRDRQNGAGGNSTAALLDSLTPKLTKALRGAGRVTLSQPPPVRGFGSEGGLEVELLDVSGGQLSLAAFADEANRFAREAEATGRFQRVGSRFSADAPSLRVIPDRDRLAALDVSLQDLVSVVGDSFGGSYVNDTFAEDRVRRVQIQLDAQERSRPEDLLTLNVRNRRGELISLANLVRLEPSTAPTSIQHSGLHRSITLQALPAQGVSSGEAIATLERLQAERNVPVTALNFAGLAREERQASGRTWALFGMGLLVVYLLLAALYESVLDPLVILITVPLGLLGVVLILGARGLFLDVYGQVGILVLISLTAKNGILIVEFANQRVREGLPVAAAIREAARLRLRPILLTAVASLTGFLPLVLARGAGAASRISIGSVVFGGLLVSTLLSLFVVPSIYELVKAWETGDRRRVG